MKKTTLFLGIFFITLFAIISCSKEENLPDVNSQTLELNEQSYDYIATSSEKGHLGRVLFYDKSLSVNNGVSCGSCHKQALAFSDNTQFSKGFENMETSRNTPPIQNLGTISDATFPAVDDPVLMWDGRENNLQEMVMSPVVNHVEMGMRSADDLVEKLSQKEYYKELFEQAFGSQEINFERISEALAGFTGSIISQGSRFDQTVGGTSNGSSQLNTLELQGQGLFFGQYNCGSCHKLFDPSGYDEPTSNKLVNIGLDVEYQDQGQGALDGNPANNGKFKIPNLRNVELTAPYMHDGRFETLSEVIDHYSTAVKNNPNLDDRLKENGQPIVFNIPENDKTALIAFLKTLTDSKLTSDPKFSDPFQ